MYILYIYLHMYIDIYIYIYIRVEGYCPLVCVGPLALVVGHCLACAQAPTVSLFSICGLSRFLEHHIHPYFCAYMLILH